MKNALLAAALLFTVPAVAQKVPVPPLGTEAAQPFKGANTVVIHTDDLPKDAFLKMGQALLATGYTLKQKDSDLLYMVTQFLPLGQTNNRVEVKAVVTPDGAGSAIAVTGTLANKIADMMVDGATPMTNRIEYRMTRLWTELQRVAGSYPIGRLTYKQQP